MNMLIFITIFLAIFCEACAQIQNPLICPPVNPKNDFDINRFLGKWYQMERVTSNEEKDTKCTTSEYSLNGTQLTVVHKSIETTTGNERIINGTTDINPEDKIARWNFDWHTFYPRPHVIIDTDYTDYAVVYSCVDFVVVHYEFVWILRRKSWNIIPPIGAHASLLLRAYIQNDKLTATNRDGCP